VSRGVNGREVISPPQIEHCQLPVTFGFSLGAAGAAVSSPAKASSAGIGSEASCASSKSGMPSIGIGSLAVCSSATGWSAFSASFPFA